MAFGFPAYHTERYDSQNGIDLRLATKEALARLSWSMREVGPMEILASTNMNFRSWGEKVTIKFETARTILITSRCALPTQCLDWGKNKANVKRFLAVINQIVDQTAQTTPALRASVSEL